MLKTLSKVFDDYLNNSTFLNEANSTTNTFEYQNAVERFYNNFFCRVIPYPEELQLSASLLNRKIYEYMWGPYEMTCSGILKDVDLVSQLVHLQMPTLIVSGEYDMATPERMKQFIQLLSQGTLKIIPDAAHCFPAEKPQELIEIITDFINH